uniref:Gag-Pol polyprotein n=1 Tax=Tanacetum cinerariifolium TaxID=118510 RepID=A0A6L2LWL1_TANCI|nr:hypothetical protein [Tanacetum cinerariifolium]
MSTQQDIYAAGFESRPPMLNKENYVPWSSRLLRYAKSRPNAKLIHNSIINDDELAEKELKQIEADDQAIQTILLCLLEDIYAVVDSCETAQEIWLRVQQMMKGFDIRIQEKKAKLFNEWERFTSNEGESIESYYNPFLKLMNDLKRNKHFPEKIAINLKFLNNLQPEWSRHVTIVHQTKDLHTTDYTQFIQDELLITNQQRISSNPRNRQIAQPGMNMGQDRQMHMIGGYGQNQFRQYAGQNVGNLNRYNAVQNVRNHVAQNLRVQNVENQNGLIGVLGNGNQNGNANLDEIEEVNANCILMANLQQASTSGTQIDKEPVYDSDGPAEVHENCDNNEIFNMFTQEEQYTEILEPIPEPQHVSQNNNNVISEVTSVKQCGETVEQHSINFEETRALYDSLYQNLAIKVEKVSSVNRKLKETNADLTTELARYKNQEKCFEISQEKYDKLERCYQQSVYQEQCLSKKINALHLSTAKLVGDFKSLVKKADESLAKHKELKLEIERLLKAVVSQDSISVVQNESVVDTSVLQTKLERTKELFENYIIKKENEYAKLWNDWYKKCDE